MANPFVIDAFDPAILGADLAWTAASNRAKDLRSGDLMMTSTGDIALVEGVQLVVQLRIRELTTPLGYFAQVVEDINGVTILDADYGNPTYTYLSEPANTLPLELIAEMCRDIMLKDARIKDARVKPNIDPGTGNLVIQVDFSLIDGTQAELALSLNL